jgi:antitoxin VapB
MTQLLEEAISKVKQLGPAEQEAIAALILARLEKKNPTAVQTPPLEARTHSAVQTPPLEARTHSSCRLADELDEIATHCASLPVLDSRRAEEILGYDEYGLPTR